MRAVALCLLLASGLAAAEDGGQPAAWTKLALGARVASLGQAVSALPDDAGAALLNPALAAAQSGANAGSQAGFFPDGRQLHQLGFVRPFWKDSDWAWSAGYAQYQVSDPLERRKGNTPRPDSLFRESASLTQLGLAVWLYRRELSFGINAKAYSHALGDATAGGYGGDLGVYWRGTPWLDLGFAGRNVIGSLGWSGGYNETLPLDWRVGARGHFWGRRLGLSLDLQNSTPQSLRLRAGVEGWPMGRAFALRLGWDGQDLGGGGGLRLPLWGLDCGLDYALAADPLGGGALQHRFSLTMGIPL